MPYIVASIISIVAALILLLTRYEADDSTIKAELSNMKVMFSMVDGFVETYVDSGGDLTDISFEELDDSGILLETSIVTGSGLSSTLNLPNNEVVWQIIPNRNPTVISNSYKLLVDMRESSGLMSKAIFSESFSGREFCEKTLFGTFQVDGKTYDDSTVGAETFNEDGTNNDGFFVCIVYK
jgi:hypothetical protein